MSRTELTARLDAYTSFCSDQFPAAAFTAASLDHVARRCLKGWPTYPELCLFLSDWWRENRPTPPALPAPTLPWQNQPEPRRPPPTDEERAAVHQAAETAIAFLRSVAQPVEDYRPTAARYLSAGVLDELNPLPNGRRRVYDPTE